MTLVDEYRKQYAWRDWNRALSQCPIVSGQHVLDLGCGPGDISAALLNRGASVTGIDGNPELLLAAKEHYPQCTFEKQDLSALNLGLGMYDGLWCSFTAAYFTDFETVFSRWVALLKSNAWVCIVDIDDLLGHEPYPTKLAALSMNFMKRHFEKNVTISGLVGKFRAFLKVIASMLHLSF
jgi:trans-aconitate methyltransferase